MKDNKTNADLRGNSEGALTLQRNDNGEDRKKVINKIKTITKNKIKFNAEPVFHDLGINLVKTSKEIIK